MANSFEQLRSVATGAIDAFNEKLKGINKCR